MKKNFIIYIATNTANFKYYVGATSRGLEARKRQHLYDVKSGNHRCRVFHDAIKKYGEDSFRWSVLCTASSFDEMMAKEINIISNLKPAYNMTSGGGGTLGFSCGPLNANHRNQVIAALVRGQKKIKKRVILVESGEIFDSIIMAAKKYHLDEKYLYLCIKGGHTCGGFTFRKLDSNNNPVVVTSRRKTRQVLCTTDMLISDSILAASERYGVLRATLTRRCDRNDPAPIGANRFCYLDEWCENPA